MVEDGEYTHTVSTIVKLLCLLFNRSLKDCLFPDSWKIAKNPSELSNYRPDEGNFSCIVFCDLSKAFDRV